MLSPFILLLELCLACPCLTLSCPSVKMSCARQEQLLPVRMGWKFEGAGPDRELIHEVSASLNTLSEVPYATYRKLRAVPLCLRLARCMCMCIQWLKVCSVSTETWLSRQERCCCWWWYAATMRAGCLTIVQIPSLKSEVLSVSQIWWSRQDAHCRCWYVTAEPIGCLSRRCLRPTPTKVSLQWYMLQALSLTLSSPRYAEVPYCAACLRVVLQLARLQPT